MASSPSPLLTSIPSTTPTQKVVPVRSPEPFDKWQTYVNAKYGYSIEHPSYWTVDDHNPDLVYLNENRQGDGAFFSQIINIGVYPGKDNLTVMQLLKDVYYAGGNVHDTSLVGNQLDNASDLTDQWLSDIVPKTVMIGNNQMESIGRVPNLAGSYGDGYWVTHGNNGYFILFSALLGESDKTSEPDQVLSTFKFIK